jgi:hypothetical protein
VSRFLELLQRAIIEHRQSLETCDYASRYEVLDSCEFSKTDMKWVQGKWQEGSFVVNLAADHRGVKEPV